jgi:sugar (pentulose or hexulose) kinase
VTKAQPDSSGPLLVGIDCGTQSAKVSVFDTQGRVIAHAVQGLRPMIHPVPGAALHPDDDLWTSVGAATRSALDQLTSAQRGQVAAVGLCPIRCCKAFLNHDGELVEPLMSWMDTRAYQPYLPPGGRVAFATTSSGYLTYRFTGRLRDTASNNVLQWPLDLETWNWNEDSGAAAQFGVTQSMLSELVMPGEILGEVTSAAAAATGLRVGIPVVATGNDKAVECLGAGVTPHDVLLSLGTYIAAMQIGSSYRPDGATYWTNLAAIPHQFLFESGGIRRGMWTLTWLLDLLGPEFADAAAAAGESREARLEREAVLTAVGADGLATVLDWLAPGDQPFRRGIMIGFDERHTRGHLYRSVVEAIALAMHQHVSGMTGELGSRCDRLIVSGGGAQSALMRQVCADVFGVPVVQAGGGAGLGAAMCAAAAVNIYPDIPTAVIAMQAAPLATAEPDSTKTQIYRQLRTSFVDQIRTATDPVLKIAFEHGVTANSQT